MFYFVQSACEAEYQDLVAGLELCCTRHKHAMTVPDKGCECHITVEMKILYRSPGNLCTGLYLKFSHLGIGKSQTL